MKSILFKMRHTISLAFLLLTLSLGWAQTVTKQAFVSQQPGELLSGVNGGGKNIASVPIEKTTYVVRDIFSLKYGHYRDAIALIDEAMKANMIPAENMRVLTDFTGDAYRLILEMGHQSLADYEKSINSELNGAAWRNWFEKFKPHVESSSREILKWVR